MNEIPATSPKAIIQLHKTVEDLVQRVADLEVKKSDKCNWPPREMSKDLADQIRKSLMSDDIQNRTGFEVTSVSLEPVGDKHKGDYYICVATIYPVIPIGLNMPYLSEAYKTIWENTIYDHVDYDMPVWGVENISFIPFEINKAKKEYMAVSFELHSGRSD